MQLLAREELDRLIERRAQPCVSIYLPTHRAAPQTREDPIRLKNLLKEAEDLMEKRGVRAAEARRLLAPARELFDEADFWRHLSDGLALFLAPEMFLIYRLPLEFRERAVVNDRFHVKPLLRYFMADGRFFVLALSQNRVRLLQGTRHTVSELNLGETPRNLEEALWYDDYEKQVQQHTAGGPPAGAGSRGDVLFHGQGIDENEKDRILRFFRRVEEGVHAILKDEHAPLLLAGVEYLHPIYREASRYPHLLDEGIHGNVDELDAQQLHDQAWRIVKPRLERTLDEVLAAYAPAERAGRASPDVKTVLAATQEGRVGTLLLATGRELWGRFDPEAARVELCEKGETGAEELLDRAAVETLRRGGVVHAVSPERLPASSSLAALFRF